MKEVDREQLQKEEVVLQVNFLHVNSVQQSVRVETENREQGRLPHVKREQID